MKHAKLDYIGNKISWNEKEYEEKPLVAGKVPAVKPASIKVRRINSRQLEALADHGITVYLVEAKK